MAAIVAAPALAQNTLERNRNAGEELFRYGYRNGGGERRELRFGLNAADVDLGSQEFRSWQELKGKATQAALEEARKTAQKLERPNLRIAVEWNEGRQALVISLSTTLAEQSPEIGQTYNAVLESFKKGYGNYGNNNQYSLTQQNGVYRVEVDYQGVIKRYTAAMGPVAEALARQAPGAGAGEREFIGEALSWLQTIPYDTLRNTATSNGAGFQTPYGMMENNRGDCETKTVALAALVRARYPSLPLVLVRLPDHIFLGVGLPQQKTDYALQVNQGVYVLADPVGPALLRLGELDDEVRAKIAANGMETIPVP